METKNLKITIIKNKYLANALSWLGFRYYKVQRDGVQAYSFNETQDFLDTLHKIIALKKELNLDFHIKN